MNPNPSRDPRAKRTRSALQAAFKDLLQVRPYQRITIQDITKRAGIARHTFYNHYGSKQDLVFELIDAVLVQFFSGLEQWSFLLAGPDQELQMYRAFFQAWKDNADVLMILNTVDIDLLIIQRLTAFFTDFYHERVIKEMPSLNITLARYVISFNSYSLLGILKPWFDSGLKHDPDHLAGFLVQLTGAKQRRKAVEQFADIFKH